MAKYQKLNTAGKKAFWKENPLNGNIEIKLDDFPSFSMYCENDDTVIKELYWTNWKGWENTSLALWANLLSQIQGGLILDIGSYTGIYAIIAAELNPSSSIYAFDIQEECINRIKKNLSLNDISNVSLKLAACTNTNGTQKFYYYSEEGIISSVAGIVPKKMNNLSKEITSIRLDDFLSESSKEIPLKLLKMDVEGGEQETLKGLASTIVRDKPDMLIEINNSTDLKEVKKLIPKAYNVYDIDEDKLELMRLGFFNKPSKHRNYLFSVKSKKDLGKIFKGQIR